MIGGYLRVAAGVLLAALVVWGLLERQGRLSAKADLVAMQSDLTVARAALAQVEEADRVHRVYLDRAAQDAQKWAQIERELRSMEGRDEPLSPYLRAAASRLWPEGPASSN